MPPILLLFLLFWKVALQRVKREPLQASLLTNTTYYQPIVYLGSLTHSRPDKLVFVGDNSSIEFNCTINASLAPADFHPSQLYFTVPGGPELEQPLEVTGDVAGPYTMRLLMMNVSKSQTGGYFCMLGNRTVGQDKIYVINRPVAPNITECRVYNWANMTCKWQPDTQDIGVEFEQRLEWKIRMEGEFKRCQARYVSVCVWGENRNQFFHWFVPIYLRFHLILNKKSDIVYDSIKLEPYRKVEPAPPIEFAVVSNGSVNGSAWVDLTWNVAVFERQVFNVTIRKEGSLEVKSVNVNSDVHFGQPFHLHINNLRPHTRYQFNVSAIPFIEEQKNHWVQQGFWSQPASLTMRTEDDHPGFAPTLTEGGYFTRRDGTLVYFQEIDQELTNGIIIGYKVDVSSSILFSDNISQHSETFTVSKVKYGITLNLSREKWHTVSLNACNRVGYAMMAGPSLQIPPEFKQHRTEYLLAFKLDESSVRLNWKAVSGCRGYKLFWCRRTFHQPCDVSTLGWLEVQESNNTKLKISVGQGRNVLDYSFAISVIGNVSGGMKWASCIYTTSDILPPLELSSTSQRQEGVIGVQWKDQECSQSTFVDHYQIQYCSERDCLSSAQVKNISRNNSYVIRDVVPGMKYSIRIRSVAHDGAMSNWSEAVEAHSFKHPRPEIYYISGFCVVGIVMLIICCWQYIKRQSSKDKKEKFRVCVKETPSKVLSPNDSDLFAYSAISMYADKKQPNTKNSCEDSGRGSVGSNEVHDLQKEYSEIPDATIVGYTKMVPSLLKPNDLNYVVLPNTNASIPGSNESFLHNEELMELQERPTSNHTTVNVEQESNDAICETDAMLNEHDREMSEVNDVMFSKLPIISNTKLLSGGSVKQKLQPINSIIPSLSLTENV